MALTRDEARRIAANIATTKRHREQIEPDRLRAERWKRQKRPGCCNKKLTKRYIVLHVTFTVTRGGYCTKEAG